MQKNRKKIVFITSGLGVGGAETQLAMLAKGLIEKEFDILIISLSKWEQNTVHSDFDGLRIMQFNLKPRLGFLVSFLFLLNAIRVEKPHIIQGWMYAGNIVASVAGAFFNARVYHSIRASNMDDKRYARQVWLSAKLSVFASAIVVNSQKGFWVHDLLGFPKDKMLIIPNGIDDKILFPDNKAGRLTRETLGIEAGEKVFLYVSRVDPMKGHKQLIKAAKLTPSVKYIFVGKGTDTLDVPNNVICLGQKEGLNSLYNAADWLISWSHYGEGFPNVIAEAMACGLPVLANDVGDSWFILGDTGFKSKAFGPEQIAKDIDKLSRMTFALRDKNKVLKRIRDNFLSNKMILSYVALYEKA